MRGEDTDREQFITRVQREVRYVNYPVLVDAYQLFKLVHGEEFRCDGSRYVTHPRAVAEILMDFGPASFEEVVTALLHDTVEDGYILPRMLQAIFGSHIAWGVVFLSKYDVSLRDAGFIDKKKIEAPEYFERLARTEHFVRRVKLADRIHNLLTMREMGTGHQRKQVAETREFILPIARVTDEAMTAALEHLCSEWELLLRALS